MSYRIYRIKSYCNKPWALYLGNQHLGNFQLIEQILEKHPDAQYGAPKEEAQSKCPVCNEMFPVRAGRKVTKQENGVTTTVMLCRKKKCSKESAK